MRTPWDCPTCEDGQEGLSLWASNADREAFNARLCHYHERLRLERITAYGDACQAAVEKSLSLRLSLKNKAPGQRPRRNKRRLHD